MIYDVHCYRCRYGTVRDQLKLYEEQGRAAHIRHLGKAVVFGYGETGQVDSYTHIVAYEDMADRAKRRAALLADPEWQAYMKASAAAAYIVSRENYILNAAPFVTR